MSNTGQAALGIVGGVVGWFIGGPQGAYYGFQIGYGIGTIVSPTQLPHIEGPRLGDGQQTVSTIGQPIPWIHGTQPVGGNIIWASPIREVATTQDVGGKGGPEQSQTTYTYYRSFAILLCEGPIAGVRRIWANGKLIYDRSPPTDVPLDEIIEDPQSAIAQQFIGQQAVSNDLADKMTIYLGTEDQMPDPVIESFEGVGNVPAYRGYAYIVFNDVELKPEDGNRIPAQWKFEVYETGTSDDGEIVQYSNEILPLWPAGGTAQTDPRGVYDNYEYRFDKGGSNGYYPDDQNAGSLALALLNAVDGFGNPITLQPEPLGWNRRNDTAEGIYPYNSVMSTTIYDRVRWMFFNERVPLGLSNAVWPDVGGGLTFNEFVDAHGLNGWWWTGNRGATSIGHGVIVSGGINYSIHADDAIEVRLVPIPPPDPSTQGTPVAGLPGWYVVDGLLIQGGAWERDESTTYRVLQATQSSGASYTRVPLNPCRPLGHPEYDDQEFWEDAYALEVARGRMPEGLVYGEDYPVEQNFGYVKTLEVGVTDVTPVSVADIVSRICDRVGLTEYDVTDLEDRYVIGYQIARPITARAAIEPLRSVAFFDVVESGDTLKFRKRGQPITATLTLDDLGAHFADNGGERPPAITTRKLQEHELPRQVRVHYQNPERDYDPGEEPSPARFDTDAETVLDVDLAVAITPTQAAQIAEIIHRDLWASRWIHETAVDCSYSEIEPADCLAVPVDGSLVRVRVTGITDSGAGLVRQLELLRDDDGTYVSHAIGTEQQNTPSQIAFYGPVETYLLDLPALDPTHDGAGIYAAARPAIISGAFRGATFVRSNDSGATYTPVGSVSDAAITGRLLAALPAGVTTTYDGANEILVELDSNDTLESRSELDVLGGANAAAIGGHGRWEIVQFINAENVAGNVWRLTTLLRGRRGTEHNVGTSLVGDTFVFISDGSLARLPIDVFDIGAPLLYRSAPIGSPLAAPVAFTANGESLKPFSPVHVTGTRNEDGDLLIDWIRRDRLATDTDEAMSEASEDYEVDILDELGEVRRTISVSDTEATYTAEMQVDDFGEPQESVAVRVYQVSATVGRGYPAEATV